MGDSTRKLHPHWGSSHGSGLCERRPSTQLYACTEIFAPHWRLSSQHWTALGALLQHWEPSSQLCDSPGSLATALKAFLPGGRQHREFCNHTGGLVVGPAFVTAAKAFYPALRQHWGLCDALKALFTALDSTGSLVTALEAFFTTVRQHWEPCDSTEGFLHSWAPALGALGQH